MRNGVTTIFAAMWLACLVADVRAADAWENITTQSHPDLGGDEIQFLKPIDKDLWIGTLSGLTRYSDGTFTPVKQLRVQKKSTWVKGEDGQRKKVVEEIREEKRARFQAWDILKLGPDVYAVGSSHGLFTMEKGVVGPPELKDNTVSPVIRFGKDLWALGKNKGTEKNTVFENSSGEWKPVGLFADMRIADMIQTSDGKVWVVIAGDGVVEVDPAKGTDATVHHQRGMNVQAVFSDSKGRVWCGMWGRGVAALDSGQWTSYLGKEKSAVMSITEDSQNNIWVATNAGGLWCFDGTQWQNHLRDEGPINLLYAASDGNLWVSSQMHGGLRYWDGKAWFESLTTGLPMKCLVEQKKGRLWAGGVLDGIHRLN